MIRAALNVLTAAFAVATIVGIGQAHTIPAMIQETNAHLGGYMTFVFYAFTAITLMLLPLVAAISTEYRLSQSNSKIGQGFASIISRARNGIGSLAAFTVAAGSAMFFCVLGLATVLCG